MNEPDAEATAALSYVPADTSVPLRESTVGGALRDAAAAVPDRVGLVAGTLDPATRRRWTYADMLREAEAVARALLVRFEPGEHVAVCGPTTPEWILLQYGAALARITLVTVNPAFRPDELAYVLGQSRAAGIVLAPEYRGTPIARFVDEIRPRLPLLRETISFVEWSTFLASGSSAGPLPTVPPDEPALILYTSGTTGFPKGAVLHHRGVTNNARFIAQRLGVRDGETWLTFLPVYNVAGCAISVLGALAARATQIVASFEPGLALALIEGERVNVTGGVPTMHFALLEHADFARRDLSSLRVLFAGGAVVPVDLVRRIEARLAVDLSIIYGQTEACGIVTQTDVTDTGADKAETIGRPLPHTEVKIVDPQSGAVVPRGGVGELCARGYLVMAGYFDAPDKTAETIDRDGWLHTGDLCSMDARGYCRIEGRLRDMIIRGGQNIYPREIEDLLCRHPAVADAAVVGIPDPLYGEVVAAFIRPAAGHSPQQSALVAFCREHLAPFKTPRHWVVVDSFPLTPSGKIQKFRLRERFLAETQSGSAPVNPADTPAR